MLQRLPRLDALLRRRFWVPAIVAALLWLPWIALDLDAPTHWDHFEVTVLQWLLGISIAIVVFSVATFTLFGGLWRPSSWRTPSLVPSHWIVWGDFIVVVMGSALFFLIHGLFHVPTINAGVPAELALVVWFVGAGAASCIIVRLVATYTRGQLRLIYFIALTLMSVGSWLLCARSLIEKSNEADLVISAGDASTAITRGPADKSAPNVVLIVVDTLRADHMSIYGYGKPTTRKIEKTFFLRSTRFNDVSSAASHTVPSIKSLITGMRPSFWGIQDGPPLAPPTGAWTMAKAFAQQGYATAGFSANPLIRDGGFSAEFDTFWSAHGNGFYKHSPILSLILSGGDKWHAMQYVADRHLHKVGADALNKLVFRWFDQQRKDQPFFLYVHYFDPHWPYYSHDAGLIPADISKQVDPYTHTELLRLTPGDPANEPYKKDDRLRELIGRYDEEIHFVDNAIGELVGRIKQAGEEDNTVIVLVGDHGEEFFEHNGYSHGHDIFQEQIRVPLLIAWPAGARYSHLSEVVEDPVSLLDVFPTLTDYLNLEQRGTVWAGRSLRSELENLGPNPRPIVAESYYAGMCRASYRVDSNKVRYLFPISKSANAQSSDTEIFDLARDPEELKPINITHGVYKELTTEAIDAFKHLGAAPTTQSSAPEKDKALQQLKGLGYL